MKIEMQMKPKYLTYLINNFIKIEIKKIGKDLGSVLILAHLSLLMSAYYNSAMNIDQQSHFPSGLLGLFVHTEAVLHYPCTAGTKSRVYLKIIRRHSSRFLGNILRRFNLEAQSPSN